MKKTKLYSAGLLALALAAASCVLSDDALLEDPSVNNKSESPWTSEAAYPHLRATSRKELLEAIKKRQGASEEREKAVKFDVELPAATDAEVACKDLASECIVIDRGCCLHEKRMVVNLKSAKELIKKRDAACKESLENKILEASKKLKLKKELKKEDIPPSDLEQERQAMCAGRIKLDESRGHQSRLKRGQEREEHVMCQRAERPVYNFKPTVEDRKSEDKYKEALKTYQEKYKEDLKKFEETPGKCVLSLASEEIEDVLKVCKLTGTAASFVIKCNKVIAYFQTGNASHAKELTIEKDGKKITIERIDRTSLKGSSSGFPKLFIIVVHPDETSTDLAVN